MQKRKKQPRKAAVEKAQQRKAEELGRKLAKETLEEVVKRQVAGLSSALERKIQVLANEIVRLGKNQEQLANSATLHDDQFCVLTRLVISRLNLLTELQNKVLRACVDDLSEEKKVPVETLRLVTYEEVSQMFVLLDEFKKRPDFKEHFRAWYLGGDLASLPPVEKEQSGPGVIKETGIKEDVPAPREPDGFPEGARIFGGDYEERKGRDEVSGDSGQRGEASSDEVQDLRGTDSDQTPQQEAHPVVPSV